jgi:TRAP-type C4-dicarboxylate transport system permease small subunit
MYAYLFTYASIPSTCVLYGLVLIQIIVKQLFVEKKRKKNRKEKHNSTE